MSPTKTELAPMKVGVAELLSRKRRFCWLIPPSYRIGVVRGVTSLAARIEVECRLLVKPPPECENGNQTSVFGPVLDCCAGPVRVQPAAERLGEDPRREHCGCL